MTKEQILERLQLTIDQLLMLPAEKFDYRSYIRDGDSKQVCPTVACVAGWYPKWFPEAPLKYYKVDRRHGIVGTAIGHVDAYFSVDDGLMDYHGIPYHPIIASLFYGHAISLKLFTLGTKISRAF